MANFIKNYFKENKDVIVEALAGLSMVNGGYYEYYKK